MAHDLPKAYEPGAIETRWADYWIKEKLFSVPTPPPGETRPVFTLLLPPPNVTGRLHMGHMLNQTQMDIIVRWHRMRGFLTLWLPGTDHAGIATQMMVERQLATEGKKRRDMGREAFIERVWEWKRHYGGAILDQMKRLGASVDWDREYFTMDENLSRAVREVFVRLHEEGLIYRGKYIVNWCPRCETAISDLEVKHEEIAGKLYEIRYPVVGTDEFITVATTRPETMLGDTAVAVNAGDKRYKHLHGKKVLLPLMNREIPIITDNLAQPEFGTGAVKVTPAHDPNDFEAGLRHNLPQIEVIDEHAHMNQDAGPYAGLDRYEARKRVLEDLRQQGFLAGEKDYTISIGKCDRCGTVVEPRLSTQWFVKIAPLAQRATEAVENGEITIVPENYKQIYLNWMGNIHDWCISRQLWWGHRIPAWHCSCGEILVARETPGKCTKCGGSELKQDTDVLDTWFSSGLLPFTTLGWPEKTRDQEVFYPTTLLITAYEILFFWVARMIMFGCHFMRGHQQDPKLKQASGWGDKKDDSVPFRQVYIHALVRDAERQKMSKTKGNVIDPLDIIQRFGTDATRFTLAAMAAPGTDIAFSESRTEGYRNFANKIWNAARFMFMNVDRAKEAGLWSIEEFIADTQVDETGRLPAFLPETIEDRFVLARFIETSLAVNVALRDYRFHEAANAVYDFFWSDFCDWYLELVKLRLDFDNPAQKEAARTACKNLAVVFEGALRLLHPIMPFITEEIWQAMYEGKPPSKSIAFRPFPFGQQKEGIVDAFTLLPGATGTEPFRYGPQGIDKPALTEMLVLRDLIASVRNLRAELKAEPKEKIPIEIFAHDPETWKLVRSNVRAIERLANVASITEVDEGRARQAPTRGSTRFDVHVIYERRIDVAAERERLKKELEQIEKETVNSERQLSNEQFLAKAPAKVVEGIRRRAEELAILRQKVKSKLDELK
jgi:valyl-tRNA synthetase